MAGGERNTKSPGLGLMFVGPTSMQVMVAVCVGICLALRSFLPSAADSGRVLVLVLCEYVVGGLINPPESVSSRAVRLFE